MQYIALFFFYNSVLFCNMNSTLLQPSTEPVSGYLAILGLRVRTERIRKSMSRRKLAEDSGVSERYLAATGKKNKIKARYI